MDAPAPGADGGLLGRLVGHRGAPARAPENTLAGFRAAAALGVRQVEFDVRLTADGHPVVIHDAGLGRTTGARRRVAASTLDEIARLDAGSWYGPRFAGEPVPRLDQVLRLLGALDVAASVEIKVRRRSGGRAEAAAVLAVLREVPALPRLLISSGADACLSFFRAHAPWIPRALVVRRLRAGALRRAAALGVHEIHCDHRHLDEAGVRRVKEAGLALVAFTVDDPARARALHAWGVDRFISDLPDSLIRAAL